MDHRRGLFITLIGAIAGFGIVMVYSASITSWPTEFERIYLSRQLVALAAGGVLAVACACLPAAFWRQAAPFLMILTIGLLAAVLVPEIGTKVNGARRWLRHGGFQFQPSELAKLALPLFVCWQLARKQDRGALAQRQGGTAKSILQSADCTVPSGDAASGLFFSRGRNAVFELGRALVPVAITAGLVMAEPDLGTAVFLVVCAGIALFAGGWPKRYFLAAGLFALPAAGCVAMLRPYQVRRLTGFLGAWSDWSQVPYQLDQSLISLGAGGLWGAGLGKGWQKLSFLPEANTDFVFSVVGEELGLAGTLGLLILWGALYWAGLQLVRRISRDEFASTAAFCLLTQTVLQAVANMAVVTALVPPKGIPLPLISYGGSALVMNLASFGIVLSLTRGPITGLRRSRRAGTHGRRQSSGGRLGSGRGGLRSPQGACRT